MAIDVYRGDFGVKELTHLLKRCLFGVKREDIGLLFGSSLHTVVDYLLQDLPFPSPPVNNYNDANYTDPNVLAGGIWINAPYTDGTANSRRNTSLRAWWIGQMITQQISLREKMVLFLHNHFATQTGVVDDSRYLYKYNHLLRTMAFGNFKDLVKQITIDPAMLKYLNGHLNHKTAPDENYARELQEVFTIGKGPSSKYTESDVKAMAKLLTGYQLDSANITTIFNASRHDITDKQFSAFYQNRLIKGRSGMDGTQELDDLMDMLFAQSELSLNICRKLYRFFVYHNITADVEQNFIVPLATLFRDSNYQIKPVLKALFTSSHFFLMQNRSCLIKSPVDFTVGLCREFEISFPDGIDYINLYYMWDYVKSQASNIQQNLGEPPNVAGWPAYHQSPQFYKLWINSDTLPKRNTFTDRMINTGYTRNNKKIIIDPLAYTLKFKRPDDPDLLINEVIEHLYTMPIGTEVRAFMKSILLSQQVTNNYWTEAWNNYKLNPNDSAKTIIVINRLKEFYKYIMNLEEYQLS